MENNSKKNNINEDKNINLKNNDNNINILNDIKFAPNYIPKKMRN